MPKFIDMTGLTYGWLTVIDQAPNKWKQAAWRCRCQCGAEVIAAGHSLRAGDIKSCGCYRTARLVKTNAARGKWHGDKSHPLHPIWHGMIRRCTNARSPKYEYYGGRGISICDEWSNMDQFVKDVGERPGPQYSLDRINNDGNYEPGNVRWATASEQGFNRRTVREMEVKVQYLEQINEILKDENANLRTIISTLILKSQDQKP